MFKLWKKEVLPWSNIFKIIKYVYFIIYNPYFKWYDSCSQKLSTVWFHWDQTCLPSISVLKTKSNSVLPKLVIIAEAKVIWLVIVKINLSAETAMKSDIYQKRVLNLES